MDATDKAPAMDATDKAPAMDATNQAAAMDGAYWAARLTDRLAARHHHRTAQRDIRDALRRRRAR